MARLSLQAMTHAGVASFSGWALRISRVTGLSEVPLDGETTGQRPCDPAWTVQVLGSEPGGLTWPGGGARARDGLPGWLCLLYVALTNSEIFLESLPPASHRDDISLSIP